MEPYRHEQELQLLQNISTILDQSIDMRSVVQPILQALDDHLGFRHGTITLLRREDGEILIESAHGLSPALAQATRYKLGEGVTGQVILTGKPIIVPRTADSPLFLGKTRYGKNAATAFICVPIKEAQEVVGALSVFRSTEDEAVLKEDEAILSIVASMVARAALLRRQILEQQDSLREENRQLKEELKRMYHPANIIGNSREMELVYSQISQVAESSATVLITGATGTGKELVAQAIHYASNRSKGPFIHVHCAALPEGLIESELFGHVKGAFTGAMVDRKGRFELADGGTIFLDEIGEVPLAIQAKLLRVIQEREFERVGGTQTIKVDVRIVAATHRDLSAMVEKNLFREDLFYRLNVFPIYVPALVKRKADIILLAEHFVKKYAALSSKTITSLSNQAVDRLMSYRWPGNVRELENCMERAVLLTDGPILQSSALPATVQSAGSDPCELDPVDGPIPASGNLEEMVGSYEKAIIIEALKATHYNAAAAARALHTTPRILSYKVKTYGIKRP